MKIRTVEVKDLLPGDILYPKGQVVRRILHSSFVKGDYYVYHTSKTYPDAPVSGTTLVTIQRPEFSDLSEAGETAVFIVQQIERIKKDLVQWNNELNKYLFGTSPLISEDWERFTVDRIGREQEEGE